ncbi:MAG: glutamate racemase [Acidobacteria bacterium]|nr:MAG: glutamate racemase [Acidobacteriota bacterium]
MSPIGVFDSGVGGITVLNALKKTFPNENFLYLGDTARLPYGTKSPKTVLKYLTQNVNYLKHFDVKAIVVACNSASTVLSGEQNFGVPLYGVIKPGAKAAYSATRNKRVGILGTRTTVQSQVYVKALREFDSDIFTVQQACPLLVPLVEEGWESEEVTERIISKYISPLKKHHIDTLILGCTHYPVLKQTIQKIVGPEIKLIDSADAIAYDLANDIQQGFIASSNESEGRIDMLATDDGDFFHKIASKLISPHTINTWSMADLRQTPAKRTYENV